MLENSASVTSNFAGMVINNITHTEKEPAAKALLEACTNENVAKGLELGSYMGFDMSLKYEFSAFRLS